MKFFVESVTLAWRVVSPTIEADEIDACIHDLVTRYEEPHRYYHTLAHIVDLLRVIKSEIPESHFDEIGEHEVARLILMCAYHDVICVPLASGCEELSALYFGDIARGNGVNTTDILSVERGIAASKDHAVRPLTLSETEHVFLDADISAFWRSNKATFAADVNALVVEAEAVGVTQQEFIERRKAFLVRLLKESGGEIYRSKFFVRQNKIACRKIRAQIKGC